MQDVVARRGKMLVLFKRPGHRVIINSRGDLIVRPTYAEASVRRTPGGRLTGLSWVLPVDMPRPESWTPDLTMLKLKAELMLSSGRKSLIGNFWRIALHCLPARPTIRRDDILASRLRSLGMSPARRLLSSADQQPLISSNDLQHKPPPPPLPFLQVPAIVCFSFCYYASI